MAKENSENTWNLKNNEDGERESSDSDDFDERPSEVSRKVFSENLISPTSTPSRGQSSAARKSPSPKTNHAANNQQQQSTFSSAEDHTFNAACSQVPSSAESEDSDDVGMYEFPSEPSQHFTSPEALEAEIMSVFQMIFSYVNTEMDKARTKRETLHLNLSRKRAFVRHPLSQTLGQFSAVSRRIASELLSTLTEQEGLESTYHEPSRIDDQLLLRCLIQESAQYFGHESYAISSHGSHEASCQQSFASQEEPTEQLVQASRRSTQESFTLDSSSSGRFAQSPLDLTSQELTSSSSRRLVQSPSEELTLSSSGGLAEASSMEVANLDLSRRSKEFNELPPICRLFTRGYSIGLSMGSENYAQRVRGRELQSRFGQMIEDLEQHLQVQTQGIPQELIDHASRMMFLLSPQATHVLNASVPRNVSQVCFVGLFVGFSLAYSQWSSRRQIFSVTSRIAPRLLHGQSPDLQRDLLLVIQRFLQEYLNGSREGFPPRSSMGFSDSPNRVSPDHALSLLRAEDRRPSRGSVRAHESSSSLSSAPRSTRPSDQEGPSNMLGRIHVLLTDLVVDFNMIRSLSDLISREYRSRDFERISSYLLCFEIMLEDYCEKESRYAALEREISSNVRRHRREAFAILHIEILMDILEHCISRVQYGALLVRMYERLGEVRTISNSIRRVTRTAMSYLMWTKEN